MKTIIYNFEQKNPLNIYEGFVIFAMQDNFRLCEIAEAFEAGNAQLICDSLNFYNDFKSKEIKPSDANFENLPESKLMVPSFEEMTGGD